MNETVAENLAALDEVLSRLRALPPAGSGSGRRQVRLLAARIAVALDQSARKLDRLLGEVSQAGGNGHAGE